MGAVDKVALYYGKCMYCNVSDAYRQGQQAGRITSTVVGTVEQVGGAFTAGAGAAMIPPTLGGGAVCTGLTVGVCALPTGGALGLEAGMVAAGAGVYIHGTGVVAFAKNNPLQSGRTPTEINKSIKSLEDLISDHTKKLEDYKNNPDQFDNQGFLRNAPNNEIRQQIINGRINHLQNEIDNWRKQIDDLRKQLPE